MASSSSSCAEVSSSSAPPSSSSSPKCTYAESSIYDSSKPGVRVKLSSDLKLQDIEYTSYATTGGLDASARVYSSFDRETMHTYEPTKNAFVNASFYAYNTHRPLLFSPDIIWSLVLQAVSGLVEANAEKLRSSLVAHEGKKKLVIHATPLTAGLTTLMDWPAAILEMTETMKSHVLPNVLDQLPEFSTSQPIHNVVHAAYLMDMMKSYFTYGFEMSCGFPELVFTGTNDDWCQLRASATKLQSTFAPHLDWWFVHLLTVIDNFVATRALGDASSDIAMQFVDQTNVPSDLIRLWDRFITKIPRGSGGDYSISGWMAIFFPTSNPKLQSKPSMLNDYTVATISDPGFVENDKHHCYERQRAMAAYFKSNINADHFCSSVTHIEAELLMNGVPVKKQTIKAGLVGFSVNSEGHVVPHHGIEVYDGFKPVQQPRAERW